MSGFRLDSTLKPRDPSGLRKETIQENICSILMGIYKGQNLTMESTPEVCIMCFKVNSLQDLLIYASLRGGVGDWGIFLGQVCLGMGLECLLR